MNMKKQLALGGALLTAATAVCLKLGQWAGKKIASRPKKKTKEEKNTKKLPEQKSGQEEQIRKSIERLPEMIRYCLKRAELKFDEKEKATTFTFPEECILEKQYVIDHKELIEKSVHAQIIV